MYEHKANNEMQYIVYMTFFLYARLKNEEKFIDILLDTHQSIPGISLLFICTNRRF